MRSIFSRLSVVILLSIIQQLLSDASIDGAQGPKSEFLETVFDAKEVTEGAIIDHAFKLTNTGDATLLIHRVEPG